MSWDEYDFVPAPNASIGIFVTEGSVFPVLRGPEGVVHGYDAVRRQAGAPVRGEGVFLGVRDHTELIRVSEQSRRWVDKVVARHGAQSHKRYVEG